MLFSQALTALATLSTLSLAAPSSSIHQARAASNTDVVDLSPEDWAFFNRINSTTIKRDLQNNALEGVDAFHGTRENALSSWFQTNLARDDTNGESWCWLKYQDDWKGAAIHVGHMIESAGGNANTARTKFCGLEMEIYNPSNDKWVTGYMVDGFDVKWARTVNSLDLTVGLFKDLYHDEFTWDKNRNFIPDAKWKFTGKRKTEYAFRGPAQ